MQELRLTPFPELHTGRLVLRRMTPADEGWLLELRNDPAVNRYIGRPSSSIQDVRLFIRQINLNIDENKSLYWVISQKENAEAIGTVCLWNIDRENKKAEIGFELLPSFQGKGLMHEAVGRVLQYGFAHLGFERIEGWTDKNNVASIRLLEKHHFCRDKSRDHELQQDKETKNMVIYSLEQAEYRKQTKSPLFPE